MDNKSRLDEFINDYDEIIIVKGTIKWKNLPRYRKCLLVLYFLGLCFMLYGCLRGGINGILNISKNSNWKLIDVICIVIGYIILLILTIVTHFFESEEPVRSWLYENFYKKHEQNIKQSNNALVDLLSKYNIDDKDTIKLLILKDKFKEKLSNRKSIFEIIEKWTLRLIPLLPLVLVFFKIKMEINNLIILIISIVVSLIFSTLKKRKINKKYTKIWGAEKAIKELREKIEKNF